MNPAAAAWHAKLVDDPGIEPGYPGGRQIYSLRQSPTLLVIRKMVGVARIELATLCSQSRCATRLRYTPGFVLTVAGADPGTASLPVRICRGSPLLWPHSLHGADDSWTVGSCHRATTRRPIAHQPAHSPSSKRAGFFMPTKCPFRVPRSRRFQTPSAPYHGTLHGLAVAFPSTPPLR